MTTGDSRNSLELLPEIDLNSALNRMMGSRQLLTDLLREFSQKYFGFSGKIKEALDDHDYAAAKIYAHTFKGSAGTLSLENLFCIGERLESTLEQENMYLANQELDKIDQILNPLIKAIDGLPSVETVEWTAPDDQEHPFNVGRNELTRLLASLSDSLTRHSLKAGQQIEESKRIFRGTPYFDPILELEIMVKKLDYNSAKTHLDALAANLDIDLD